MSNAGVDKVADEILRIFAENPHAVQSFGGDAKLKETLDGIKAQNETFEQKGGVFFERGGTAAETAQNFVDIHIKMNREDGARPTLPVIAMREAEKMGLESSSAEYKALMMVSARAEMQLAHEPDYHNKNHYLDVATLTAAMLDDNAQSPDGNKLSTQQRAWTLIAAIGHDIDHDGAGNTPDNPMGNEKGHYGVIKPLLEEAGISAQGMKSMEAIILCTSPNGPSQMLDKIFEAHENGETPDMAKIDPDNKFPEIHHLAQDPEMARMSYIVGRADLGPSAGMGLEANAYMSQALTDEVQGKMDFRTDGARMFFMNNIVGNMGGREADGLMGDNFRGMKQETVERLDAAKPKETAPPVSKFAGTKIDAPKETSPAATAPAAPKISAPSARPPSSGM